MLSVVAKIETPTTRVEVLEGTWPQPVEYTWHDPRPVVTLLLRDASYQALGRFGTARARSLDRIGSVFFIPPDHELYGWGSGGRVKVARCLFDGEFYRRMAGKGAKLSTSQLSNALNIRNALSRVLLSRLMKEALSPGFAAGVLAESLGGALLVESLGQALDDSEDLIRSGGLSGRHKRIIDDYREELDHDVELNPPSVSVLAARCGLSVRQFSRRFRQENGTSVGRYLGTWQIERAQNMVTETALPLKEIAFRLGFSNAANFSTAFSAACGVAPAAYRRKFLGPTEFIH
jgi:AraC family transcriptional regulator